MRSPIKRERVMSEINITPFTDVVLVLLIIFMVTTPILLQPGIKVQMPKAENSENTPDKTITILIDAQGGIVLDKSKVSIEDMKAELVRRLAASPDTPVVLKADKDVRYDVVVSVIDAAKGSGAKRFALGVEAKPGETPVR